MDRINLDNNNNNAYSFWKALMMDIIIDWWFIAYYYPQNVYYYSIILANLSVHPSMHDLKVFYITTKDFLYPYPNSQSRCLKYPYHNLVVRKLYNSLPRYLLCRIRHGSAAWNLPKHLIHFVERQFILIVLN